MSSILIRAGIDNFATAEHGYFAYYTPHEAESFRTALHDLKKYIETDGPFDGLIAFSQGTALASAFLMEQLSSIGDGGRFRQPFQCAIFLCGRPPFLDTGFQPPGPVAGEDRGEKLISIPTVHIWGSTDYVDPGQALALSALCGPQNTYVYIHPGGHEVPGPRDKVALINSANSIRRMLTVV